VLTKQPRRRRRVLAVASSGGHWVQLLRILPALEGCDVAFATVTDAYRGQVEGHRFYRVSDATLWNKVGLVKLAIRMAWVIGRERPDVVISTGAAPGYFALVLGRLLGAKTIWLDSITNIERMSVSGTRIGPHADLWLTQWEHLATPEGPRYGGAVL
jgi:UDP-N-acetylglucosamine:LPS N-acetylglucosamine transferase